MTVLSPQQVAGHWIAQGGPASRAVEWVAIALGESGYRTDAVSPAGAVGLWQIMPFNAPPYGISPGNLSDPSTNAYIAVRMSGHGANCAAWDSAYADIYRSGRYSYLSWPEPGSADYNNLAVVSVQLGHDKLGGAAAPMPASPGQGMGPALSQLSTIQGQDFPALARTYGQLRSSIAGKYRTGWRP